MTTTPRGAVGALSADPQLVSGTDERFTGYGVMGVAYVSGHYLALRDMVASSVGPAYRAIWHRDPAGTWTIYTTTDPMLSCPRYFGGLDDAIQVSRIDLEWRDDWTLTVAMAGRLFWHLHLGAGPATRMMSALGGAAPGWAWDSTAVLAGMGPMASGVLGSGRIRLAGVTPNGQGFRAAPLRVWRVMDGRARLDGVDLGPAGALAEQARLGDFWLPQRGLFFSGRARFSATARVGQSGDTAEARS